VVYVQQRKKDLDLWVIYHSMLIAFHNDPSVMGMVCLYSLAL